MVLNQMSDFWFEKLGHIVPNHLTGVAPESVVAPDEVEQVKGRAVVAKRLKPIMVEAVVRGYIIGSGWKDYQDTGSICGIALPAGLKQAEKLPEPLFTPAAKADQGFVLSHVMPSASRRSGVRWLRSTWPGFC